MNTRILLLVLGVAALTSCASVYKTGQTPDDVYYSPGKPKEVNSYAEVRKQKEGTNYQTYEQYQDQMRDDRFLRMSVGNPYYMNGYDMYSGFDWRYNSYYDGFNYGLRSPWNNYFAWNNFYNPYSPFGYYNSFYGGGFYGGGYYSGGGIKSPSYSTPISRPVAFNVNSYGNNSSANRPVSRNYVNNVNNSGTYYNNNGARYNNSNNYNNANSGRSYYNNSGSDHPAYSPSSSSSNTYTPSRSYSPSSGGGGGGSTGGGGGGGGSAPSRPSRGN